MYCAFERSMLNAMYYTLTFRSDIEMNEDGGNEVCR